MPRIAFMGAGSTIFAKSVLGDCILTPEIQELEIALHDIDPVRLEDNAGEHSLKRGAQSED